MKTSQVSKEALVLLGALVASFAACSAQSSGSPPREVAGSGSTGTAGATGFGTAGAGTGFGTAGAGTGFGTAGAGTGFGTAGAGTGFGTGGSSSSGGAATTGTAGATSGAMSCGTLTQAPGDAACCVAAGTTANLGIDSLEDLDNVILPVEQRQGYWYTYSDKGGATTLMPSAATFPPTAGGHACSLLPAATDCAGAMAAPGVAGSMVGSAQISGVVAAATATVPAYVGLGFDFNNHFKKSCAYNATAYKGITFWAKGSPFKAEVTIPTTLPPDTTHVGTCVASATAGCNDNYFTTVAPPPDGMTWKQFTITFGDPSFAQAGWGVPATFTASSLIAVQFQIDGTTTQTGTVAYSFAVDDIAFF